MSDKPDPVTESPSHAAATTADDGLVRFLRILVTALTATMILGLITVVYLLVTRLPPAATIAAEPRPVLPDRIVLPDGAGAEAVTIGRGWIAVVTDRNEIIVLDAATGAIRQRVRLAP